MAWRGSGQGFEHRGRGYADEILAEITRILASEPGEDGEGGAGAAAIHADTDLENRPMAAAFDRAHYRTAGHRLVLSAPPDAAPPETATPETAPPVTAPPARDA